MTILAIAEDEADLAFVAAVLRAPVPGCETATGRSGEIRALRESVASAGSGGPGDA